MSDAPPSARSRKVYLLDRASQASVAWNLILALAALGLLYAYAIYFLLSPEAIRETTVEGVRSLMLMVHAAYFGIGGAILAVWILLLAHRYSGPAFVMRRAIQAMRKGDFSTRLLLRKRDYHRELASELCEFRAELHARTETQRRLLEQAQAALKEGDVVAARQAIAHALGAALPQPSEPATVPV